MTTIITAISSVVTAFVTWFGEVFTELIGNDLVLLILGLGIAGIVFGYAMVLIGKVKGSKRRRR